MVIEFSSQVFPLQKIDILITLFCLIVAVGSISKVLNW